MATYRVYELNNCGVEMIESNNKVCKINQVYSSGTWYNDIKEVENKEHKKEIKEKVKEIKEYFKDNKELPYF